MRKELFFDSQHSILDFILKMEKEEDEYFIENDEGFLRVSAHSVNGTLYAARDFDHCFLINKTNPECFPNFLD